MGCRDRRRRGTAAGRAGAAARFAGAALLPGVGRWQLAYKILRGRIAAITWSSDGGQIAYQEASAIRICDARTFETQHILLGHSQQVLSIDWNRTTHLIASTSLDGTVRIWSADGVPLTVLTSPHGPINCAAWAPNGDRLAWGGADGTVRIVKADGSTIGTFRASEAAVNCLAWSPDGRQIATGDDKQLTKSGTSTVRSRSRFRAKKAPWRTSRGAAPAGGWRRRPSASTRRTTCNTRPKCGFGTPPANKSPPTATRTQVYGLEWSHDGLSLAVLGAGTLSP